MRTRSVVGGQTGTPVTRSSALMRVGEDEDRAVRLGVHDAELERLHSTRPDHGASGRRRQRRPRSGRSPDGQDRPLDRVEQEISQARRWSSRCSAAARSSSCAAGCSRHGSVIGGGPPAAHARTRVRSGHRRCAPSRPRSPQGAGALVTSTPSRRPRHPSPRRRSRRLRGHAAAHGPDRSSPGG